MLSKSEYTTTMRETGEVRVAYNQSRITKEFPLNLKSRKMDLFKFSNVTHWQKIEKMEIDKKIEHQTGKRKKPKNNGLIKASANLFTENEDQSGERASQQPAILNVQAENVSAKDEDGSWREMAPGETFPVGANVRIDMSGTGKNSIKLSAVIAAKEKDKGDEPSKAHIPDQSGLREDLKAERGTISNERDVIKDLLSPLDPIPKLFHMTWKDKNIMKNFPNNKYVQSLNYMMKMNPGWKLTISDDADVEQYLKDFLSEEDYLLLKPQPFIQKLDLWRLVKIFKEGGFYQDMDRMYNIPMSEIIRKDSIRCVLPSYYDVNIAHSVMICAKGSPFHKLAIEMNLELRRQGVTNTLQLGPHTYTEAIKTLLLGKVVEGNRRDILDRIREMLAKSEYTSTMRETGEVRVAYNKSRITKEFPLNLKSKKRDLFEFSNVTHWQKLEEMENKIK